MRPDHISEREWTARVQLAACYRIFDYLGWTELIYNHITLRLPGPEKHFLINPFGMMYEEITASSLIDGLSTIPIELIYSGVIDSTMVSPMASWKPSWAPFWNRIGKGL